MRTVDKVLDLLCQPSVGLMDTLLQKVHVSCLVGTVSNDLVSEGV